MIFQFYLALLLIANWKVDFVVGWLIGKAQLYNWGYNLFFSAYQVLQKNKLQIKTEAYLILKVL